MAATKAQPVEGTPLSSTVLRDYSGAADFRRQMARAGRVYSPFAELCADLLGAAFYGLKHLDDDAIKLGKWDDVEWVEMPLPWHRDLSNYDDDRLTRLIVMCHDAAIRVSVCAGLILTEYDHHNAEGRVLGYDVTNDPSALASDCGVELIDGEEIDKPNDDFDADQPEDPEDNPRTVKRLVSIGTGPCLVLRLRLIVPDSRRARGLGHGGVKPLDEVRAGIELRAWPRGYAQANFPAVYAGVNAPEEQREEAQADPQGVQVSAQEECHSVLPDGGRAADTLRGTDGGAG